MGGIDRVNVQDVSVSGGIRGKSVADGWGQKGAKVRRPSRVTFSSGIEFSQLRMLQVSKGFVVFPGRVHCLSRYVSEIQQFERSPRQNGARPRLTPNKHASAQPDSAKILIVRIIEERPARHHKNNCTFRAYLSEDGREYWSTQSLPEQLVIRRRCSPRLDHLRKSPSYPPSSHSRQ